MIVRVSPWLLVAALAFGCSADRSEAPAEGTPTAEAPKTAETPKPVETPPEAPKPTAEPPAAPAGDGSKPGEHGCGSCLVRACVVDGAIPQLRVDLRLDTKLTDVRYTVAMLRVSPAGGGGMNMPLPTQKLQPNGSATIPVKPDPKSELATPDAWKGATASLMLYWEGPKGRGGQQMPLAFKAGACP